MGSVLYDEHQVLPASSRIEDFAGSTDVCLSAPSVVNHDGVQPLMPVPLRPQETDGLHRSAQASRAVIHKLAL
jgi:L-lactate dehydrogenase